jgi:hypothetical protein
MTVITLPTKTKTQAPPAACPPTQTFLLHVELPADDAKLINRFIEINQHKSSR